MSETTACASCGEGVPADCPKSKRLCGHHCNHSWTHDACDWCGKEFTPDDDTAAPVNATRWPTVAEVSTRAGYGPDCEWTPRESDLVISAIALDRAQRAAVDHAKIEAVRALCDSYDAKAASMAPEEDWGQSISDTLAADTIRAVIDHFRAVLDDATTTRPPPCPSRWASNRGVHCRLEEHNPELVDHTNGVVSWSEAEAAR